MCGRYVRRSDKQKLAEYFHANPQPVELPMPGADYNIAPTTFQPIVRQSRETGDREMVLARWGLVPFFTKTLDDVKGLSTINARAESITKAPTWREPMKKRRSTSLRSTIEPDAKRMSTFALCGWAYLLAGRWRGSHFHDAGGCVLYDVVRASAEIMSVLTGPKGKMAKALGTLLAGSGAKLGRRYALDMVVPASESLTH